MVVVEVPDDSDSDAETGVDTVSVRNEEAAHADESQQEACTYWGVAEESSLFETEIEDRAQRDEEDEQERSPAKVGTEDDKPEDDNGDGDSAYGSFNIEVPEAACPSTFAHAVL